MYSKVIVEEKLDLARQDLGFALEYHAQGEVDTFEAGLRRKYEDEYQAAEAAASGSQFPAREFQTYLTRALCDPVSPKLSPAELRWILNERYLSMCDAAYWMTRYFWIKNVQNDLQRFTFRPAQRIYFDVVAELERRGLSVELLIDKARQLGICLSPETRVLTADLRWVTLDQVNVGDKLVSVDENPPGMYMGRRLWEAIIEAKRTVFEPACRLVMDNGTVLVATPQHRFLGKVRGSVGTCWRSVGDMRIGDEIRHVVSPWEDPDADDHWFAGLSDGEGSLRPKSHAGCEFCVSQVDGAVWKRAKEYLQRRGYTFREEWDRRDPAASSKFGSTPVGKLVVSRIDELFKLMGQTRPTRFDGKVWWQGKELPGKKVGAVWGKVVALEALPSQRMIDLQTSTKTFIAEGFVSHNSTETEGFIGHRAFFTYGASATLASADQSKTSEMANMLFLAYDMMPWHMRPLHTRRVESDRGMLVFGGQRSGIKFQHGTQTGGISQGTTPTIYHLAEVAYYPDPEKLIEVGLFKAVHPSPKVFGALESTARGDVGWWPDKYWYYKRSWPNCRMLSLFFPWFLGTDLYPNPTWLRQSPIPRNWRPRDETHEMIARAELYVKSNSVLERVLGVGWSLPREQAWWWEVQYNEALDGGKVKTFLQEYPTDDQESFQGSYESVFGRETIASVYAKRATTYAVYGVVGQSIEDKNEPLPDDVDYNLPRIPVHYNSNRGDTYRWELVPLRWRETWDKISDIREVEIPNGMLMVFRPPEPGFDYSLGVDTSTGIGDEATVLAMARRAITGSDPDIQVAEFRSNLISHVEAYPFALCLAAYYAKHMASTTRYREPYVSIEQVQAVGDTVYKDMWKMGYSRFHRMLRYDSKPRSMKRSKANKTGWFTNTWSRPILTDNFVVGVQNGWYVVNSPWTIWEMQHWETRLITSATTGQTRDKKVHSSQSTDDGIFANAMAWFCPNDLRSLTERTKKKCPGPGEDGTPPQIDLGPYGGQIVSPKGSATSGRNNLENLR